MVLARENKRNYLYAITVVITVILIGLSSVVEVYSIGRKNLNEELLSCANYNAVDLCTDDMISQIYSIETILGTEVLLSNDIVELQKASLKKLANKESSLLNPYPIITTRNSISKAYSTTDMGTMHFAGQNVHLYYSSAQSVVDAYNSAAVLGPEFGSDPIGIPGGCSIIGDHNFQTGKYFANLRVGSKIYIKTSYGQFLYQVTKIAYGYITGPEIYTDDGIGMVTTAKSKGINGVILYTCYPFNAGKTTQRYLVFAKLIEGTELT